MPDYKALIYESSLFSFNISQLNSYKKDSPTTKLIDNAINAECYNTNQKGSLQRISNDIDSQKITELMKNFNSLNSKKLTEKEMAQAKELLTKKAVEKKKTRT